MSQQHPLFPVTMNTHWQHPQHCSVDASLLDWLLDPNSLTARLKTHCQQFKVQVLGQSIEPCSAEEANNDIDAGEQVLVREVLLYCDDIPQVFARSLMPLSSLTGEQQQLAHLGTQSLGQVLFNHPDLTRKCIEISSFDSSSSVADLSRYLDLNVEKPLWGRRSVFVLAQKPVMVAEIFLPNAFAYSTSSEQ
ncbi:chorismate--pyruvate lyase family protein [Thalassotalea sp. PLHSN55]|uniref:chorismate--pyruvate lyase family protein n=1 Tax=Thalassotalea sp. PLHSN55 TaxID=3435888 RepID=UPI003F85F91D